MSSRDLKSDAEIKVFDRKIGSKGDLSYLRATGNVPGVLYSLNGPSKPIFVESSELVKIFSSYKGRVSSLIIKLIFEDGSSRNVSVKEIQYDTISYKVIHLDFHTLDSTRHVNVNIPVFLKGVDDCVGVKLGGVLRQVIRRMKVRCLPNNIPARFDIDVSGLQIKKSIRLSSIDIPDGVSPVSDVNQVAVVVAKR